jgi:ribose 5-phosphate isomerase B
MIIIIPLGGTDNEFKNEYNIPRILLRVSKDGRLLIEHFMDSINITNHTVIFIVRRDENINFKIGDILKTIFSNKCQKIIISEIIDTKGSLSTSNNIIKNLYNDLDKNENIVIFTSNVIIEPQIEFTPIISKNTNTNIFKVYSFKSNNPNHCYISTDSNKFIIDIHEKYTFSKYALTGIYQFYNIEMLLKHSNKALEIISEKETNYISDLLLYLINKKINGKSIIIGLNETIDNIHCIKNPSDYKYYIRNILPEFGDKPVGLCSDHSGYKVKNIISKILDKKNIRWIDYGCLTPDSCNYGDSVEQASKSFLNNEIDFVFGSCRTGQGINMAANHYGFRSAILYDENSVFMSVNHNNANFYVLPGCLYEDSEEDIIDKLISIIKNTRFQGGRHYDRINKFYKIINRKLK